jgi:hypothetical protein
MPVIVATIENGRPGDEIVLRSVAFAGGPTVVFEDDGETGTFYARARGDGPILDALHVYSVEDVADRARVAEFKIGWSASGRQAILLINGGVHAVFDFDREKGWCRSAFSAAAPSWSLEGHQWDDACLAHFR